ncbi:MAG: hypothetical protein JW908_04380 [Anaerolineales bacterium]|nr:hypothetical protein [Anaerolineales bacterium]
MKTNTSATLYSRSIVNGSEVWTRSAISAVFWENRKAANVIKSGLLAADSAAVYIPDITVSIKVGDVLVKGAVTKTISPTYTMTNLRADYTTITVKSVDLMDYGSAHMQHIQVGGG